MKICEYVPHGAVPDIRGFAPAIVAQNFAKFLKEDERYIISNLEEYKDVFSKSEYGDVYRIGESALYRRLFRKITRLDPYPLHVRAAKIVNTRPVDIFHAHQLEFDVKDFRKRVDKNTKIAVHVHAMRSFAEKRGVANRYIACSEYTKNRLINEKGYPKELIDMVYNGADTDLFAPPSMEERGIIRKRLRIPNDSIVVSYIGRKQEAKGYRRFLKAAEKLQNTKQNLFFICVGPTPLDAVKDANYSDSTKIEAKLASSNKLFSFGPMTHDKLSDVYKATDIVYFPTAFGGEQHPVVGVEAISSGCILIASKFAGIVETIEDGKTGFLINYPPSDDEGLEKLEHAINYLDSLDDLRQRAREFALNTFSWDITTRQLANVFKNL